MQTVKEILKFCDDGLKDSNTSAEEAAKLHIEKGGCLVVSGRFEEAKKEFLNAIKKAPNFAEAYNNLSKIYSLQGDFDKAEECGAKAHELDADTHDLNWLLAREGKRMTDKLMKNPIPALFYKRGILFDKQGAHEKARDDFKKAIELDPGLKDAYKQLGDVYLKLGEVEKAVEVYDDIADLVPDFDFKEEDYLFKIKKWEHLIKKVELNPRASDCAQLAVFYSSQRTLASLQKARTWFRRALELDPNLLPAQDGLIEIESMLDEKGHIDEEEYFGPPQRIPDLLGLPKFMAVSDLRTLGLKPQIKYKQSPDPEQNGHVIEIDPPPGTLFSESEADFVTLTVGHPGLTLESIEGIGPKFQEILIENGIADLASLSANPDIGNKIPGLSVERSSLWADMANWLLGMPEIIDGNSAELAVVGLGLPSPEDAYEKFLGMSLEEIKDAIREAAKNVELPANYVDEHLDSFAELLYEIR